MSPSPELKASYPDGNLHPNHIDVSTMPGLYCHIFDEKTEMNLQVDFKKKKLTHFFHDGDL